MSALAELLEAAEELAELIEADYYYDDITLKRWVLGDGGVSGNCELCVDNSELGWIDQDDIFEGVEGDIDEPPAHPHCTCSLETKDTRRRVYA